MKQQNFFSRSIHLRRGGFTLTEVLLAVMIVGLVAVALASLTRAAARESGAGRSKIMLRNNLSTFLRTLRTDMAQASRVDRVSGAAACNSSSAVTLLELAQNVDSSGNRIISSVSEKQGILSVYSPRSATYITYCFRCGTDSSGVQPSGAKRGGKIYRLTSSSDYLSCSNYASGDLVLDNVKWISGSYSVPYFGIDDISRSCTNSLLSVHLITELNSNPIMNEAVEETFAMPMGY